MPIYNKLIRDLICQHLDSEGITYETRTLNKTEYRNALRAKLQEELKEYLAAENPQEEEAELADLVEVIFALADSGAGRESLERERKRKLAARGGFVKRLFLIRTDR